MVFQFGVELPETEKLGGSLQRLQVQTGQDTQVSFHLLPPQNLPKKLYNDDLYYELYDILEGRRS